ncbi:exocyst complex component Sec10-like protein [Hygrophoropsis aurantiaca]|uniref:Exocyst complex component Sec10-like protein n=1 Tax=Hygrophoropsis aurantiaca TaxID=72124 RepID=A0ACB8A7I7_9AGAM|nr:exocyst complex component Sec10-like protein [Hygrophoropsis aurantiaca]
MHKFTTLEPTKLYVSPSSRLSSSAQKHVFSSTKRSSASAPAQKPWIGRLPADVHLLILAYVPIPDIAAYAVCSRATSGIARDESVWERRYTALGIERYGLGPTLDAYVRTDSPRSPPTSSAPDDEFGEFTVGAPSLSFVNAWPSNQRETFRAKFLRAHTALKPLLPSISSVPHATLAALFPSPTPLTQQAKLLHLLALFLSPRIQPTRASAALLASLNVAIDRFDVSLLTAFDGADSKGDERRMREASEASWQVWGVGVSVGAGRTKGEWEMGKVWADKREIFYETEQWDPLANFTPQNTLSFTPMDAFIAHVLAGLEEHGSRATRVFPPTAGVLWAFADRVGAEVIGEYISTLLARARQLGREVFLQATAATFREAWRVVDGLVRVAGEGVHISDESVGNGKAGGAGKEKTNGTEYRDEESQKEDGKASVDPDRKIRERAEDVVYKMFETNMDEYLDEEIESLKQALDVVCKEWERTTLSTTTHPLTPSSQTRFLTSQNPALVKRNVLASFTDVLLLPVTIVPRAVAGAGNAVMGVGAVQGFAMLNPQRWGGGGGGGGYERGVGAGGVVRYGDDDADALFEIGEAEEDVPEVGPGAAGSSTVSRPVSIITTTTTNTTASTATNTTTNTTTSTVLSTAPSSNQTQTLDLLLSLDVALSLIHADRESLKRLETFASYPGHYGRLVRDTIEEVFCLMLGAVGERHVKAGFDTATDRMAAYKPSEHESTASVAPLVQFFELVHVGDMIQSIVQVYFDKELAQYIDRTDFLNVVVREKKRFENILDDCVAAGLNAGTQVLMNQVEHIILTLTKPREYYPSSDAPLELGPTRGCTEAIRCLETHCKLLKGSTSKEVLEVFHTEVGIRLIAILQKHIKRQIISLNGGFQVIADLNTYYAFIASLKVPSITADFSHLKMLGHVFVVEDAKDLAQIVKDVTRYGGAYRPEDIYEFIQRRSDWKKIEKTVDKTMYNLSFKEDCVVC